MDYMFIAGYVLTKKIENTEKKIPQFGKFKKTRILRNGEKNLE